MVGNFENSFALFFHYSIFFLYSMNPSTSSHHCDGLASFAVLWRHIVNTVDSITSFVLYFEIRK